jgi:hypothetical protein
LHKHKMIEAVDEEPVEIEEADRVEADQMAVAGSQAVDSEAGLPGEVFQEAERPEVDLLVAASRAGLAVGHQVALAASPLPICCVGLMRMVTG